jgi:TPR repeat protein
MTPRWKLGTLVLIGAVVGQAFVIDPRATAQARPVLPTCQAAESADTCFRRGLQLAEESGNAQKTSTNGGRADAREAEALSLLRSACSRDEGDACYFAGRIVATPREWSLDPKASGVGPADSAITASLAEAAKLFRKGCYEAKRPSAAACTALGDGYTFGIGQPIQLDSAFKVLERGCNLNYEIACFRRAARLDPHPEYGPERRTLAYNLAQKACAGGSPTGCLNVAYVIDTAIARLPEAQHQTEAFQRKAQMVSRLYRESCRQWMAIACSNIGALFENGRYGIPPGLTPAQRLDSARHYYTLACDGVPIRVAGRDTARALGHGYACWDLGNLAVSAVPPDTAAALVQYRKGCLLFERLACAELALKEYMFHHDSAEVALLRAVTACNERLGAGCNYAGWLLREPAFNQTPQALNESLVYFRRACNLDYAWSCYRLGELEPVTSRRAKYYRRACGLQEAYGCNGLASLLETKFAEPDRAVVFYERACTGGMAKACWAAKGIRRTHDDLLNEGLDRTRACALDPQYCKKRDRSS